MYYYNPEEREAKELVPGINAKTFWAEKMLAAVVDLDPNVQLPRHSHPHEQSSSSSRIRSKCSAQVKSTSSPAAWSTKRAPSTSPSK